MASGLFLRIFHGFSYGFSSLFVGVGQALTGALPCQDVFVLKTRAAGSVSRGSGAGSAWFHHVSWGKCGKISKQMDELLDFGAI